MKELKKGIPVTPPSAPRPLTVPATIPEKDQLFCEDKNKALPGVAGIQVFKSSLDALLNSSES